MCIMESNCVANNKIYYKPADISRQQRVKICTYFKQGLKCKHGINCRYAHAIEESNMEKEIIFKKETAQKNYKTSLCIYIRRGIPCENGPECKFAHNIEEHNVKKCRFQQYCMNNKTCQFIHDNESMGEYYFRMLR